MLVRQPQGPKEKPLMTHLVDIRISSGDNLSPTPLLVLGCFEGEPPPEVGLPEPVRQAVERAAGRSGFRGKSRQQSDATPVAGDGGEPLAEVVSVQGLGKRAELEKRTLRCWVERVLDSAHVAGVDRLTLVLPDCDAARGEAAAERILRAVALGAYRFDRYKDQTGDDAPSLASVELVPPPEDGPHYERTVRSALGTAYGVAFARDLANTPGNIADPAWMEDQARDLAERHGIEIRVLQKDELQERGMGGILAVGAASACPPRLVRLDYGTEGPVVALVGKGVTFDTGGISIKPAANMEAMKYDKGGACAVLGIFAAVAQLGLPVRLRGYVPLAENMPGGAAYRPGDILDMYDGTTVEVINTDAEGRLILADALAWAAEEEPETLLEFSTLTGACVVALGTHGAGLFTPDDDLARDLLAAAEASGDRLWRLPLWSEFREEMQGNHGDLRNAGSRWGGAATAAAFLSHFVRDLDRWAHMDIAGPAQDVGERSLTKGATGYGVASTVAWLRHLIST
jgi:leucyl aminopeptidase